MFKQEKKAINVEFEEVDELAAAAEEAGKETDKEIKPKLNDHVKSGLKTAAKVACGFVLGLGASIALGTIASRRDDEEEVAYLYEPNEELSEEDED